MNGDTQEGRSAERAAVTGDGSVVLLNEDGTWRRPTPRGAVLLRWRSLDVPSSVVEVFRGLFEQVGVRIQDTGEAFTCTHSGTAIEFDEGLDEGSVDFTVEIHAYQAEALAERVSSDKVDTLEQFRINRVLFNASLSGRSNVRLNPLMSNPMLRWMIGGTNLIHLQLISPDTEAEPHADFTLIYIDRGWLVVPGSHGVHKRKFRVSVEQALELQRHLFAGMQAGLGNWMKVARWYVQWRKQVEIT